MAYTTSTCVQSEFKNLDFTKTNSTITTAEVDDFICQADEEINMYLCNRYVVPITGTAALKIVKKLSIDLVAYRIAKILNIKKAVPVPDKFIVQQVSEGTAYKLAMRQLEMLQAGKLKLRDATVLGSATGLDSYFTQNKTEPCLKKDDRQW